MAQPTLSEQTKGLLNSTKTQLPDDQRHVIGAAIFAQKDGNGADRQLLIVKRAAAEDDYPNSWEIPGGHLEDSETIRDCVARETKEETGLEVIELVGQIDDLKWDSSRNQMKNVQHNFVVKTKDGIVKLNPEEHSEYRWLSEGDLGSVSCTEGMRAILKSAFSFSASRSLHNI